MRLLLCFILFCSFYWCSLLSFASTNSLVSSTPCTTTFGKELGSCRGVVGYSNCNSDWESNLWNTVSFNGQALRTGMKWQCVEYARRWYMAQLGYTFASIDHAYQIWDLNTAQQLGTQHEAHWVKFDNGKSTEKPTVHDLLIYNKQQGIHGHVSVITEVQENQLFVAEQNHSNTIWKHKSYARVIPLIKNENGQYKLDDLGVIGWMRLKTSS